MTVVSLATPRNGVSCADLMEIRYLLFKYRRGPQHPRMPDETASRIFIKTFRSGAMSEWEFIDWELTAYGTLAAKLEFRASGVRFLWVIDFDTFRPRRFRRVH